VEEEGATTVTTVVTNEPLIEVTTGDGTAVLEVVGVSALVEVDEGVVEALVVEDA